MPNRLLSVFVIPAVVACGGSTTPESEAPVGAAVSEPPAAEPAEPATSGPSAPDFTLGDLDGNQVSLSSFRGKTVVLEWFNPGCPFVKYAHGTGPLKDMAKTQMAQGVVWLAINSGAAGKQGHGVDTNKKATAEWAIASPVLIDETGSVGKSYGATTTPHMFVIDRSGAIAYKGALDNAPLGKAPAEGYVNYVEAALTDMEAGRPVKLAETQSYGCSVKYAE
jgi:peroxiredoxin